MMSSGAPRSCAKCSKTVYPIELLNCLDKFWHKSCFRCTVCNMTLNMKNYKGYEKFPYCNAHYPRSTHTQVADTPENARIKLNTKLQSNVQYHAEFERQKGHKVSVPSDPEMSRIKKNTENQSDVTYKGVRDQRSEMEKNRPNEMMDDVAIRKANPGKISDYDPAGEDFPSPYSQRTSANVVYDSQRGEAQNPMPMQPPPQQVRQPPPQTKQPIYRAMYDYAAADDDEVSFIEGDDITNVSIIDEGWMTGTVKRTGQHGMLPSNYVERVN